MPESAIVLCLRAFIRSNFVSSETSFTNTMIIVMNTTSGTHRAAIRIARVMAIAIFIMFIPGCSDNNAAGDVPAISAAHNNMNNRPVGDGMFVIGIIDKNLVDDAGLADTDQDEDKEPGLAAPLPQFLSHHADPHSDDDEDRIINVCFPRAMRLMIALLFAVLMI
jgi:hypothetical protein